MNLQAGVARVPLTPFWGVELAGWGYYLERRWQRVRDDLHATALVLDNGETSVAVVSLDLMIADAEFTRDVRQRIMAETGLPAEAVLVACTHTHSAPAAGGYLAAGETDPLYKEWAARQAATAVTLAWHERQAVRLSTATGNLVGHTFNRSREDGPVDTRLTTLRIDRLDRSPLAMVVNFQAHPTVGTKLRPCDVSRDVPGEVCDVIEAALPGVMALYLQGSAGDVEFLPRYSTPELEHEPARLLAGVTLACQADARPVAEPVLAAVSETISLPARRWTQAEIDTDRDEARRRLQCDDISDWQQTIGRAMAPNPVDLIARHGGEEWLAVRAMCRFNLAWTFEILKNWDSRPEAIETEVQALRIGDLTIVANSAELFSAVALDVRSRLGLEHLMVVGYANGRIGYLPDAEDIVTESYAASQSPKFCLQFPFIAESATVMADALVHLACRVRPR